MWPFKQKPATPGLDERLETLERGFRSLRLDWEDTYEKLARMAGRIAKRAAIAEKRLEESDPEEIVDPGATGRPEDDFSKRVRATRRHA